MSIALVVIIGALFSGGFYLVLRRSIVKILFGLILLGHGAHLLIFLGGGLVKGSPPLIAKSGEIAYPIADPLPQALVLTAIVISFAVIAFTAVLILKTYQSAGSDDVNDLGESDL